MAVVTAAMWVTYASANEDIELSYYNNLETAKKIETRMEKIYIIDDR